MQREADSGILIRLPVADPDNYSAATVIMLDDAEADVSRQTQVTPIAADLPGNELIAARGI